jgi:hypothetical protein
VGQRRLVLIHILDTDAGDFCSIRRESVDRWGQHRSSGLRCGGKKTWIAKLVQRDQLTGALAISSNLFASINLYYETLRPKKMIERQ